MRLNKTKISYIIRKSDILPHTKVWGFHKLSQNHLGGGDLLFNLFINSNNSKRLEVILKTNFFAI